MTWGCDQVDAATGEAAIQRFRIAQTEVKLKGAV